MSSFEQVSRNGCFDRTPSDESEPSLPPGHASNLAPNAYASPLIGTPETRLFLPTDVNIEATRIPSGSRLFDHGPNRVFPGYHLVHYEGGSYNILSHDLESETGESFLRYANRDPTPVWDQREAYVSDEPPDRSIPKGTAVALLGGGTRYVNVGDTGMMSETEVVRLSLDPVAFELNGQRLFGVPGHFSGTPCEGPRTSIYEVLTREDD